MILYLFFYFLWKMGDWFAKWKRGGGGGFASFARHHLSFLLDSQVIRIFRLNNRLIILRAVTYLICGRMCFRAARD